MESIISIKNIFKSYKDLDVLKGVSLDINKGEVISLIGASGSGKSTLVRCINGLEQIQKGNIYLDGEEVKDYRGVAGRVGMVFQNFNLFPHYTVLDNIIKPLRHIRRIPKEDSEEIASGLLKKVKLIDKADVYPSQLSGGQKQRLAIARALSMDPEIILFDEPTSSLDPQLSHEVFQTIKDLAYDGYTMIIVTHHIKMAIEVSTRIVFLDKGKIEFDGNKEAFINTNNEKLQRFLEVY
ncbi:MAG: amino acid ABC transporter ATP-binding protein [Clostridioides difficile]|nr:amino acid ABC transporter ATP-binding protein [Clostridioides sp.]MBS5787702.1 amino acid ABC transporter ATP-binding protein [Clostridioides difficile]